MKEMIKHEKSCGAIVCRKYHGNLEILLVQHLMGGHWSFPKGHVEKGETEIQTALREIKEETGIEVMIDHTFRQTVIYSPKQDVIKKVVYFIARAKNYDFSPQPEEISQIRWLQFDAAYSYLTHEKDKQLLKKARPFLKVVI